MYLTLWKRKQKKKLGIIINKHVIRKEELHTTVWLRRLKLKKVKDFHWKI